MLLKAADGAELLRAQQWLDRAISSLQVIPKVLSIDDRVASEFDRLRQNKKLKKIGKADLLIAAITLANRATLVTRNLKDFRQVPGLSVENWAD
jgi:tRNA(fMet)-specific endonuclease VapC